MKRFFAWPSKRWTVLLVVWATILLVYQDTASGMVGIWLRSDTFTHGFLVPPLVGWLIWRQRDRLAAIESRPAPWALLPLFGAALAWLIGDLAFSNSVTQMALVTMLVLAVPVVMGTAMARALLFPLAFLYFAVPFGEFLMPQLMEWTATFTVNALQWSGIPVYREALHFIIPSGSWSVVEACSGVRYLIASVMGGTLFAYLNFTSLRRRLLFVGVSFLVPILANWVRAYLIVLLGHLSDNKLAAGVDHLIYGWFFFGIVIGLMFYIGSRWAQDVQEFEHDATGDAGDGWSAGRSAGSTMKAQVLGAASVLLLATPQLVTWNIAHLERLSARPVVSLPPGLAAGWSAPDGGSDDAVFKPAFDEPTSEAARRYVSGDHAVDVYLGYYHHQDYDNKLASSTSTLVRNDDPRWAKASSGIHAVQFADRKIDVAVTRLRGSALTSAAPEQRLLAWQVYWIGGSLTSSSAQVRLLGALQKLAGRGDDTAVIVLSTRETGDASADSRLEAFLQSNLGLIDAQLRAAQDRRTEIARRNDPATAGR